MVLLETFGANMNADIPVEKDSSIHQSAVTPRGDPNNYMNTYEPSVYESGKFKGRATTIFEHNSSYKNKWEI